MKSKIRILSVINELVFGGDENRLLTLATSIDRERFDLQIVTLKRPDPSVDAYYGTMREQYAAAGVPVRNLGEGHRNQGLAPGSALRQARRVSMFWRAVAGICRIVREERIDILDGHTGPGNLIAVAAGVASHRRRVVTTYNVEQWEPRWLWHVVQQATLGLTDAIVTDSGAVADATRRFTIARPLVHVIPNGVVPPRSTRTNAQMRRLLGLPEERDVRIVGQVSSLFPTKGHMVLIEAARAVLERQPNTAFLLVGYVRNDPSYRDRLERRARELGIAERIRIVSYPGQIGDIWQVIDVHVHPTLLDSLPNAIIEGMSLGKPAVVTDIGGIATLVEHGRTGLVVRAGDADSLADGILRLLEDEAYARALGGAARSRYEQGYTPRHMADRLQRLFENLVA